MEAIWGRGRSWVRSWGRSVWNISNTIKKNGTVWDQVLKYLAKHIV